MNWHAVALQHGFFDFGDSGHGVVGGGTEFAAGIFAVGAGLGHGGEGLLVLADGSQLLVDHGHVGWLLDQFAGGLQAGVELAQQVVDGARALFAAAHFVVQAGDTQVFGQAIDAGDEPQLVATAHDAAQAGPAREGDQQRQQQHQTEADPQFAIDAYVSQLLG